MVSILEMVKGQLGSEIVNKIAGVVGEDSEKTSGALGMALPAILGGIVNKGADARGAGELLELFHKPGLDGSLLDGLGTTLDGASESSGLLDSGQALLGSLFGASKLDSMLGMLTRSSGMGRDSMGKLAGLVTPIAVGVLGKHVRSNGLNASGLMNLLAGQKSQLEGVLPAGFDGKVGAASGSTVGQTTRTVGGFLRWLPLVALVLLGLFLLPRLGGFFSGAQDAAESATGAVVGAAEGVVDVASDAASSTAGAIGAAAEGAAGELGEMAEGAAGELGEMAAGAAGAMGDLVDGLRRFAFPGGVEIDLEPGTTNYQLATFLMDSSDTELPKSFVFDHLNFEFGTTVITAESRKTVDDLATILRAVGTAEVSLEGHTDARGAADANVALSERRAQAVWNQLAAAGIDEGRVSTRGWGEERPIASNETDEGRAQNRRLELVITKR